jgi:hypothetical protein
MSARVAAFAAAQLFGRHVARRAERDSRLGQPRHRWRIGLRLPAGKAKVEHFDLAVAAADHVFRFQIAVDDAHGVGRFQCARNVDERGDQLPR